MFAEKVCYFVAVFCDQAASANRFCFSLRPCQHPQKKNRPKDGQKVSDLAEGEHVAKTQKFFVAAKQRQTKIT